MVRQFCRNCRGLELAESSLKLPVSSLKPAESSLKIAEKGNYAPDFTGFPFFSQDRKCSTKVSSEILILLI
ncbi:MAG: hypothetical protein AB1847_14735 [bacterium]